MQTGIPCFLACILQSAKDLLPGNGALIGSALLPPGCDVRRRHRDLSFLAAIEMESISGTNENAQSATGTVQIVGHSDSFRHRQGLKLASSDTGFAAIT